LVPPPPGKLDRRDPPLPVTSRDRSFFDRHLDVTARTTVGDLTEEHRERRPRRELEHDPAVVLEVVAPEGIAVERAPVAVRAEPEQLDAHLVLRIREVDVVRAAIGQHRVLLDGLGEPCAPQRPERLPLELALKSRVTREVRVEELADGGGPRVARATLVGGPDVVGGTEPALDGVSERELD